MKFSFLLGSFYAIIAFILMLYINPEVLSLKTFKSPDLINNFLIIICNPVFMVIASFLWLALYKYAFHEDQKKSYIAKLLFSLCHTLLHLGGIIIALMLLPTISSWLMPYISANLTEYFDLQGISIGLSLICIALISSFWSGCIWGIYLFLSSFLLNKHCNDAFGTLSLASYKNFLRMCIKNDTLTIYPIGLKKCPTRWGWRWNKNASKRNQNEPRIIPKNRLQPFLIEDPIRISFD